MNDHAESLRAIADMLDDETGVDTQVTAIKALEVVIDKLGGSTRPDYAGYSKAPKEPKSP